MTPVQRKITYRLYPNANQAARMDEVRALHCRVYNTLLEEHQRRHGAGEPRLNFAAMCKELTGWRHTVPALRELNAQSMQVTAKRVSLAFEAFFRRCKAGETPGFPRFKAAQRFSGWGYKTYGDGWKLLQPDGQHGRLRLTGLGEIPMRGKGRFTGSPKTLELLWRGNKWYASVTYDVTPEAVARLRGPAAGAFDWGLTTLLTLATHEGPIETVENPRWLKTKLATIKDLSRAISAEEARLRAHWGLAPDAALQGAQRSAKLNRLSRQLSALHSKASRQRKDFYHKLTAGLVSRFAVLGTEKLAVTAMSKAPSAKPDTETPGAYLPNGASRKAGLNRSILDAAPSMLLGMLRTKAAEAASVFAEANTRHVKPTQRCHRCGALVKKSLADREHICACGLTCGRDENAAKTLLRWVLEGDFWLGTSPEPAQRRAPETPPIAALAV